MCGWHMSHSGTVRCGSYLSQNSQVRLASIPGQPTVARIHARTAKCGSYPSWDSQVQLASVPAKCSSHLSQNSHVWLAYVPFWDSQVQLTSVLGQPTVRAGNLCLRKRPQCLPLSHLNSLRHSFGPVTHSLVPLTPLLNWIHF